MYVWLISHKMNAATRMNEFHIWTNITRDWVSRMNECQAWRNLTECANLMHEWISMLTPDAGPDSERSSRSEVEDLRSDFRLRQTGSSRLVVSDAEFPGCCVSLELIRRSSDLWSVVDQKEIVTKTNANSSLDNSGQPVRHSAAQMNKLVSSA